MGGGHGILEGPGDLAVGYRRWGGVMGYWRDLGIWLSGIGGGEAMGYWRNLGIWLSGIGGGGGHGILERPGEVGGGGP